MEKDELYKLLQEGLREIEERQTRKFEEVAAACKRERNKDRIREIAFDKDGVFAKSDTFTLRKIRETDKEDYLNLYRVKESYVNLFDRPEYKDELQITDDLEKAVMPMCSKLEECIGYDPQERLCTITGRGIVWHNQEVDETAIRRNDELVVIDEYGQEMEKDAFLQAIMRFI